jgi:mRNA deadenylase 3'-5' endonuclease subunit Ccr4
MTTLNLSTFNVLAPCWATPSEYPASSLPYLDKVKRREHIIQTLLNLANSNDVIALQETQEDENNYFSDALSKVGFNGYHVNHRDDYWSRYITVDPPFVSNGVSLFWNKKNITLLNISNCPLSDDGNHCILATFKKDNKTFRLVCCHLDSDTGGRRSKEAKAIMDLLTPTDGITDIVIGDLNFNTDNGPYNRIFYTNNFTDVLKYVGKEEMTHPFDFTYMGNSNYGVIDHILVRNAIPIDGKVLTFNVWVDGQTSEERINLLLQRDGSDHFVVSGTVSF